jgi:hypothetical protein
VAYTEYYEVVQEIYLAYYGRAADKDGLAYWSGNPPIYNRGRHVVMPYGRRSW